MIIDNSKYFELIEKPDTLDKICQHVSNGGSLINLCELWEVQYSAVFYWIDRDEARRKQYHTAIDARVEWMIQRLLAELKALAFVDVRRVFDAQGDILPPDQWPSEVAKAVAGLDVSVGLDEARIKKVKFYDKLKSIDLLGKQLGMFIQRHEVTGKVTLEDLIASSNTPTETTNRVENLN